MPVSQKASAETAILSALNANNPFERPPVVKEQNIWGESFPDIPSLNAKASDSLFEALKKVRAADSSLEKVTSLVFTADRGVGKSHVIKRVRRRLQATSEGIFIYASADRYGDLSLINLLFQQSIAESLEQIGSAGVTQWQEIATLMVAEALKSNNANAKVPAAPDLVKRFDRVYHDKRSQNRDLVKDLVTAIRKLKPSADAYILRAIVWTLSEERGPLAVKWLAGEQLDAQDAADLRLPPNNKSEGEANASAPTTIAKLLSLIGEYRTVIVCFDELDTIAANNNGYTTAFVILDLIKRLFDSVGQSAQAKGIVTLTVLLPDLWRQVKQSKDASSEKISAYGEPIDLEYLNVDATKELCALTLGKFYEKKGLTAPVPIYPFDEDEITAFGKGRPSAREALKWFSLRLNEKLEKIQPPPLPPKERFAQAYQNALDQFDLDDLETNAVTAEALKFCFKKMTELSGLKDQVIEGVVVRGVEDITPKSKNDGRLHFKLVGEEKGEPVVIGIGVIQETHGLSVGAGFRRLLDTETFGLSRGCLVRSRDRKIKRYWDSFEYYQQLIANGGEWVDLVVDDIKPLLALQYVYEHHEKFDLTHKRLDSFAFTRNLIQDNPLLKEILSRPEGQVVEDALEGEELQRLSDEVDVDTLEADLSQSLDAENELLDEVEVRDEMQEFAEALSA
ncbi:MAG: hypothetical protein WA947_10500 [Phormidesmis sp.]